jgi:hypothetical protein
MDDLDNLTEDQLQELMNLGIIPDQQTSLDEQINQAQRVRNREAPRGYDTGRVYVAASPLEHLAYALNGIKAEKDLKNLRSEQQGLLSQQASGRMTYLDALLGRLRAGRGNHSYAVKSPSMADVPFDEGNVPSPEVNF